MGGPQRQAVPRVDDDDSADEAEQISTRSLALTRYKRNHELMNEVFMYAAFGDPAARAAATAKAVKRNKLESEKGKERESEKEKIQTPYSIFDEKQMNEKITKLNAEIAELEIRAAERREVLLRRQAEAEAEAEAQLQVQEETLNVDGLEAADVSMEGITV